MDIDKAKDYPVTISSYALKNGKWTLESQEFRYFSGKQVETILSDSAQPFERSHRLYKQGHTKHRYDTYETIRFDYKAKCVWYVGFEEND